VRSRKLADELSLTGDARDYIAPNVGGYVWQPANAAMDLGMLFLE
jgi:hypothetical protein